MGRSVVVVVVVIVDVLVSVVVVVVVGGGGVVADDVEDSADKWFRNKRVEGCHITLQLTEIYLIII